MPNETPSELPNTGLTSPIAESPPIEVRRTYLAMTELAQLRPGLPPRAPASLVRLDPCSVEQWRALYSEIGGAWHWHDRDAWSDEQLATRLANSSVSVYHVRAELVDTPIELAGFLELEIAPDGSAEIVYLGLHSRVFGMGLGAWLLGEAVKQAFALGASRVWLHTCTLDSPAALPNYLARGFRPEREEIYLTRLAG